jgi:hypothetical protein
MQTRLALAASLGCLLWWPSGPGLAQPVAQNGGSTSPAKVWVGRYAEYEEFLKTASIVRTERIPIGITEPTRAYFEPGGLAESAVVKALRPSRDSGYFESYQSEVAAYELDKLLGLDMVPVTVERTYTGQKASAQLWVEDAVQLSDLQKDGERSPDRAGWNRQVRRWRVFVNLIANVDPNEGNNLVVRDPDWRLVLVDHSRAFTNRTRMIMDMTLIDRPFFERLKALDKDMLDEKVSPLILDGSRSLLRRRDAIVEFFEQLAKEKGDAAVFSP